jgi:serine/threonine protein kinase
MHSARRIGRYRIERCLGTGAFGTVWLARDDDLDAQVAVKVLAENWAHRLDVRERFLSEARMLRKAGSPRVVRCTTSVSCPTAGRTSSWSTPTPAPSPTWSPTARCPCPRRCG